MIFLGKEDEAKAFLGENLLIDAFDFVFRSLLAEIDGSYQEETITGDLENYLQTARNFAEFGLYDRAISALLNCDQESPLKHYYLAYYYDKEGKEKKVKKLLLPGRVRHLNTAFQISLRIFRFLNGA